MLELLIPIPNLYAAYTLSENNAYKTNLIYIFGYLPFIFYNLYIKELWQAGYFLINWILAFRGVMMHLWSSKRQSTVIDWI